MNSQLAIGPWIVGISGISGSGKTHYLRLLKGHFGENATSISLDDYYKPLAEQISDANGMVNFDLPSSVNHVGFLRDLQTLSESKTVTFKKYQFENYGAPEQFETLKPAKIIFAEGLFIFDYPEVDQMMHMRCFINTNLDISLERRLRRDETERGITAEKSLYQWHNHVLPAWEKHILPHKQRCDIVIDNNGATGENMQLLAAEISRLAGLTP